MTTSKKVHQNTPFSAKKSKLFRGKARIPTPIVEATSFAFNLSNSQESVHNID